LAAEASASGTEFQMSAAPVAVEIDGVFVEIGRQELGQPHGAGPGAFHVGELDGTVFQHFQRQQEFLAEFLLALAEIGLRRQDANGVVGIARAAVIGLAAEDREQHCRRNAELALDRGQRRVVLVEQLAALRGQALDRCFLQIISGRQHKFRLTRRGQLRPSGDNKLRQRQIGLKPARRRVESGARHAELMCLRPQRLQPGLEGRVGRECTVNANEAVQQGSTKKVRGDSHRPVLSAQR
jgi:hypothetical protein